MRNPTSKEGPGKTTALFHVEGLVQGVGYRWWTKGRADELGLGGSVRNLPDGSVEVSVTGETAAVEQLQSFLKNGPAAAVVERVTRHPLEISAIQEPAAFHITG